MSTDFHRLIPELSLWMSDKAMDVGSWLSCVGNYEHAIAYGDLFWPEFEEHDGCVFRKPVPRTAYDDWLKSTDGDKDHVQAVMNHVHLLDLFHDVKSPPTREQIVHLGRKLKETWGAKLRHDFPNREIVVSFLEEGCADLLDYEVTFLMPVEKNRD